MDHIRRFKQLGYENRRDETGYGKRLPRNREWWRWSTGLKTKSELGRTE